MYRPPNIPTKLDELPSDPNERHSALVDVFGLYMMWTRAFVLDRAKLRGASDDAREHLGSIFRAVYEQAAALDPQQQEVCLQFAQRCVDDFAQGMLVLLANGGDDLRLGDAHSVRLRLDLEIYDIDTDMMVVSDTINRGSGDLAEQWGRWINRLAKQIGPTLNEEA